jgi:hypothetical protein
MISSLIILMLTAKTQGQEIQRPPVWGIAKMTFLVSDFELARDYYSNFPGFDKAFFYSFNLGKIISFEVNDHQVIEFIEDKNAKEKNRLVFVSFETDDLQKMKEFFESKGTETSAEINVDCPRYCFKQPNCK